MTLDSALVQSANTGCRVWHPSFDEHNYFRVTAGKIEHNFVPLTEYEFLHRLLTVNNPHGFQLLTDTAKASENTTPVSNWAKQIMA